MSGFLLGVPAQLKTLLTNVGTLLTRWSQTKADFLDAGISSRAPSSTALSTATWTGGRAAALDTIAGIDTKATAILDSGAIDSVSVNSGVAISSSLAAVLNQLVGPAMTQTVISGAGYVTIDSITGKGVLEFLAFSVPSHTGGSYGFRLTIDGVVVHNLTNTLFATNDGLVVAGCVGVVGGNLAGVAFGHWPFNASLLIEVYSSGATGTLRTFRKYRRST